MIGRPDFDKAECLARELRLFQSDNSLRLNVRQMEFDRNIEFDTFKGYSQKTNISVKNITREKIDGYTVRRSQNNNLILYRDDIQNEGRLQWTLAHEVGHIYMNHDCDNDLAEIEANWFASELLIPIPILFEITKKVKNISASTIADMFGVSYQAACKKISSLKRMYGVSNYLWEDFVEKYAQIMELHTLSTKSKVAIAY